MYVIFAVICALTFVMLLGITVKVVIKVGSTDLVIPLMLIMLQLSAISKCPPIQLPA